MRVLWLTEHYPPSRGGMSVSSDRIVANLRRLGIDVDVVHWSRRSDGWARVDQHRGSLRRCPLGPDPEHALARTWAQVAADAATAAATHVVAFGGVIALLAGPVFAARLGVPLVTLLRGNDADTGVFSPRRRAILAEAVLRSAHVCAVSRDKVELVRAMWPATGASWTPNGIDLEEWRVTAADRDRAACWRQSRVTSQRRVLGMFGHLKAKKGAGLLVDALATCGAARRWHLHLVGELEPQVRHACETLLEPGAWTHTPFGDRYELLWLLPACDAVAIPSFYDGLPNVLLEAAACGVPFVASTAGGMGDLLVDGQHGRLFPPGDADALRRALADVAAADDGDLRRWSKAVRALAEDGFDAESEARRYLDVLRCTSGSGRG